MIDGLVHVDGVVPREPSIFGTKLLGLRDPVFRANCARADSTYRRELPPLGEPQLAGTVPPALANFDPLFQASCLE